MKRMQAQIFLIFFLTIASLAGAETIIFRSDKMSGRSVEGGDYTKLEGRAFIKTRDMEINANTIELSGEDFRFITATGNVSGINTETGMEFSCALMRYDRQTEIARLETDVHMVDKENNVVADAQIIEYNQQTDIAILQIAVNIVRDTTTCISEFAIYRKNEQMLELSGNPRVNRDEDTFRAQEIRVNLDTEEITLDGRVSGSVTSREE